MDQNMPPKTMERQRHQCTECNKTYAQRENCCSIKKNKHTVDMNNNALATATGSFCNELFSSKSARSRQESVIPMNHKQFSCDISFTNFSTFYGLRGHMAANHGGAKFKYEICGATFCYKHTLKQHQERCANKNHPKFSCGVCETKFTTKRALKVHKDAKISSKTFVCEDCVQKFKYTSSYKRHKKREHTV